MASLVPSGLTPRSLFDEEALIEEARRQSRRRRRRVGAIVVSAALVAGLVGIGAYRLVTTPAGTNGSGAPPSPIAACSRVQVTYLGADAFPGAAVSAGILVKASVSSVTSCFLRGYATMSALFRGGSSATASPIRLGIFGGAPSKRSSAPLPSLDISNHPRIVSFTVAWVTGNGNRCPRIDALRFTVPGSHNAQVIRSFYNGGVGNTSYFGISCGQLSVTPLVAGSTGRLHFGLAPPAI
jgi:hypothetical protein